MYIIFFCNVISLLWIAPSVFSSPPSSGNKEQVEDSFLSIENELQEKIGSHPEVLGQYKLFLFSLQNPDSQSFSKEDVSTILKAASFAADIHRNQFRRNTTKTPYIAHPLEVANHLLKIGRVGSPAVITAALLHDTLAYTSFNQLRTQFGNEVANYVKEVSGDKNLPYYQKRRLEVLQAPHLSQGAALIQLSDKLCNLTNLLKDPPPGWTREKIDYYFLWSKMMVDQLPDTHSPLQEAVRKEIAYYWNESPLPA